MLLCGFGFYSQSIKIRTSIVEQMFYRKNIGCGLDGRKLGRTSFVILYLIERAVFIKFGHAKAFRTSRISISSALLDYI